MVGKVTIVNCRVARVSPHVHSPPGERLIVLEERCTIEVIDMVLEGIMDEKLWIII